jgi:hypothetical protein
MEQPTKMRQPTTTAQSTTTAAQPMVMNLVLPLQFNVSVQNQNGTRIVPYTYLPGGSMLQGLLQGQGVSGSDSDAIATRKRHLANSAQDAKPWNGCIVTVARPSTPEADVSAVAPDDDLSVYLMSLLISDRPMITEEQVEIERAQMTDDERVEALTDLYGKQCGISTPRGKRARRDLDNNLIDFLVKMMRLELERIPKDKKRALLEAQMKCRADEFSDSRLERFLRCEGMDVKVEGAALTRLHVCVINF